MQICTAKIDTTFFQKNLADLGFLSQLIECQLKKNVLLTKKFLK